MRPETDTALRPALIVAGPTCSGKSALALAIAERVGGTVINADSMQVYREIRVLTAQPDEDDAARVPHALYGIRAAATPGNVAWWRDEALSAIAAAEAVGRVPILCGGTGLYLLSLTAGLSAIPDPGAPARAEARSLLADRGSAALHAMLAAADPASAAGLRTTDGQRVARAWEVWRGTGRGLAAWRSDSVGSGAVRRFSAVRLDPPRTVLRDAIAERFAAMLAIGAIEEVRALLADGLDPTLPAMRAHGVPEIAAYLAGRTDLDLATARAVQATCRYTKRQATWFRHHALASPQRSLVIGARIAAMQPSPESIDGDFWSFIERAVDGTSPPL